MNKRVISILGLVVLVVTFFISEISAANTKNSNGGNDQVTIAKQSFNEELSKDPETTSQAIISLSDFVKPEEILDSVEKKNVKIESFYHGYKTFSGGYVVPDGLTSEQIKNDYYEQYASFLNDVITKTENQLSTMTDDTKTKALENLLNQFKERRVEFQQNGIPVYGIKVKGKVKDLDEFRKTYPKVRAINIKSINKFSLPISPNN